MSLTVAGSTDLATYIELSTIRRFECLKEKTPPGHLHLSVQLFGVYADDLRQWYCLSVKPTEVLREFIGESGVVYGNHGDLSVNYYLQLSVLFDDDRPGEIDTTRLYLRYQKISGGRLVSDNIELGLALQSMFWYPDTEETDWLFRHSKRKLYVVTSICQPNDGVTRRLPETPEDERVTHVAVNIAHGHKFFCEQVADRSLHDDGKGNVFSSDVSYYIRPSSHYGRCYNGCSLWQGGFKFYPLGSNVEETVLPPVAATYELPKKATPVASDVREVLANSLSWEDGNCSLTQQVDRKLYSEVNKVLVSCGGKWSRKHKRHVFDESGEDAVHEVIEKGYYSPKVDLDRLFQFFPTPDAVVEQLCDLVEVSRRGVYLEPSAGDGAIAKKVRQLGGIAFCVELFEDRAKKLRDFGFIVECMDFMQYETQQLYDGVVMNPPFTKGQDVSHVLHAMNFLRPGSKLASVMSPGWRWRSDKRSVGFREFLLQHEHSVIELPAGTFRSAGTMVDTVLVCIEKR